MRKNLVMCLRCRRQEEGTRQVVDLGSGAGLPVGWGVVNDERGLPGSKRWVCGDCLPIERKAQQEHARLAREALP